MPATNVNDKMNRDIRQTLRQLATAPGRYFKGSAKLFLASGSEIVQSEMPGLTGMVGVNKDLVADVGRFLRSPISTITQTVNRATGSEGFAALQKFAHNALDDLRTGNFYDANRDRSEYGREVDSLLDNFGGLDMTAFDANGDYVEKPADGGIRKSLLAYQEKSADQRTGSTIQAIGTGSSAIASTLNANAQNDLRMTMKQHGQVMGGLQNMITQQGAILQSVNAGIASTLDVAREIHGERQEKLDTIINSLGEIKESLRPTPPEEPEISQPDFLGPHGELNIRSYLDAVRKNADDRFGISGAISMMTGGRSIKDLVELFGNNPWELLSTTLLEKALPESLKNQMKTTEKYMEGFFPALLGKLSDRGKRFEDATSDEDRKITDLIAGIFGVQPRTMTGINTEMEDTSQAAALTVKTVRAIEEVIPAQLAQIHSAITGKELTIYNYKTGKFESVAETIARETHEANDIAGDMGSSAWDFRNRASQVKFANPEWDDQFDDYIYSWFQRMAKEGRFIDYHKDREDFMDEMPGGPGARKDAYYEAIMAILQEMPRSDLIGLNSELYSARMNQAVRHQQQMKDLRDSGLDIAYSGIMDPYAQAAIEDETKKKRYGMWGYEVDEKLAELNRTNVRNGISASVKDSVDTILGTLRKGIVTYTYILGDSRTNGDEDMPDGAWDVLDDQRLALMASRRKVYREMDRLEDKYYWEDTAKAERKEYAKTEERAFRDTVVGQREHRSRYDAGEVDADGNPIYQEFIAPGTQSSVYRAAQRDYAMTISPMGRSDNPELEQQRRIQGSQNYLVTEAQKLKKSWGIDPTKGLAQNLTGFVGTAPFKIMEDSLKAADAVMFKILYGEDAPDLANNADDVHSLFRTVSTVVKTHFNDARTWFAENIGGPLKDYLFNEETGLVPRFKSALNEWFVEPAKEKFKGGVEKLKTKALGTEVLDEEGNGTGVYEGGWFSNQYNRLKAKGESVTGTIGDTMTSAFHNLLYGDDEGVTGGLIGKFRRAGDNLNQLLFGPDADGDDHDSRQKFEFLKKEFDEALPDMAIGGGLGLLASVFLPGGPVLGALLGMGGGFLKSSETFKQFLFGEQFTKEKVVLDAAGNPVMVRDPKTGKMVPKTRVFESRKGGLIDSEVFDGLKQYLPKTGAGAGIGWVIGNGLFPGIGGAIGGALIGSLGGMIASSDRMKRILFGDEEDETGESGLFSKNFREKLGKNLLGHGGGLLAGRFVGGIAGLLAQGILPGGLGLFAGQLFATLGSTIGLISGPKIADMIFGTEQEVEVRDPKTGKMVKKKERMGGLFGKVYDAARDDVISPLAKRFNEVGLKIGNWFDESVITPFAHAMEPAKQAMHDAGEAIKDSLKNIGDHIKQGLDKVFDRAVGMPLGEFMKKKVLEPLDRATSKFFGFIGKVIGGVISAPFKAMEYIFTGEVTGKTKQELRRDKKIDKIDSKLQRRRNRIVRREQKHQDTVDEKVAKMRATGGVLRSAVGADPYGGKLDEAERAHEDRREATALTARENLDRANDRLEETVQERKGLHLPKIFNRRGADEDAERGRFRRNETPKRRLFERAPKMETPDVTKVDREPRARSRRTRRAERHVMTEALADAGDGPARRKTPQLSDLREKLPDLRDVKLPDLRKEPIASDGADMAIPSITDIMAPKSSGKTIDLMASDIRAISKDTRSIRYILGSRGVYRGGGRGAGGGRRRGGSGLIGGIFGLVGDVLGFGLSIVGAPFKALAGSISGVASLFAGVVKGGTALLNFIGETALKTVGALSGMLINTVTGVVKAVSGVLGIIPSLIGSAIQTAAGVVSGAFNAVGGIVGGASRAVGGLVGGAVSAAGGAVRGAIDTVLLAPKLAVGVLGAGARAVGGIAKAGVDLVTAPLRLLGGGSKAEKREKEAHARGLAQGRREYRDVPTTVGAARARSYHDIDLPTVKTPFGNAIRVWIAGQATTPEDVIEAREERKEKVEERKQAKVDAKKQAKEERIQKKEQKRQEKKERRARRWAPIKTFAGGIIRGAGSIVGSTLMQKGAEYLGEKLNLKGTKFWTDNPIPIGLGSKDDSARGVMKFPFLTIESQVAIPVYLVGSYRDKNTQPDDPEDRIDVPTDETPTDTLTQRAAESLKAASDRLNAAIGNLAKLVSPSAEGQAARTRVATHVVDAVDTTRTLVSPGEEGKQARREVLDRVKAAPSNLAQSAKDAITGGQQTMAGFEPTAADAVDAAKKRAADVVQKAKEAIPAPTPKQVEGQMSLDLPRASSGITNATAGPSVVGEHGKEVIWNDKTPRAKVVGINGPEVVDLKPGDNVIPNHKLPPSMREGNEPLKRYAAGTAKPDVYRLLYDAMDRASAIKGAAGKKLQNAKAAAPDALRGARDRVVTAAAGAKATGEELGSDFLTWLQSLPKPDAERILGALRNNESGDAPEEEPAEEPTPRKTMLDEIMETREAFARKREERANRGMIGRYADDIQSKGFLRATAGRGLKAAAFATFWPMILPIMAAKNIATFGKARKSKRMKRVSWKEYKNMNAFQKLRYNTNRHGILGGLVGTGLHLGRKVLTPLSGIAGGVTKLGGYATQGMGKAIGGVGKILTGGANRFDAIVKKPKGILGGALRAATFVPRAALRIYGAGATGIGEATNLMGHGIRGLGGIIAGDPAKKAKKTVGEVKQRMAGLRRHANGTPGAPDLSNLTPEELAAMLQSLAGEDGTIDPEEQRVIDGAPDLVNGLNAEATPDNGPTLRDVFHSIFRKDEDKPGILGRITNLFKVPGQDDEVAGEDDAEETAEKMNPFAKVAAVLSGVRKTVTEPITGILGNMAGRLQDIYVLLGGKIQQIPEAAAGAADKAKETVKAGIDAMDEEAGKLAAEPTIGGKVKLVTEQAKQKVSEIVGDAQASPKVAEAKEAATGALASLKEKAGAATGRIKDQWQAFKRKYKEIDRRAETTSDSPEEYDKAIDSAGSMEEFEAVKAAQQMNVNNAEIETVGGDGEKKKGGFLSKLLGLGEEGGGLISLLTGGIGSAVSGILGSIPGLSALTGGTGLAGLATGATGAAKGALSAVASGGSTLFGTALAGIGTVKAVATGDYGHAAAYATRGAAGAVSGLAGFFSKVLTKLLANKTVAAFMAKVGAKAGNLAPNLTKAFSSAASKLGPEALGKLAAKANMIGLAVTVATAVYDFGTGIYNAGEHFNIRNSEVTDGMRLAAGLAKAISGFAFGLLPVDWLAQFMWKLFASAEDKEKLAKDQEDYASMVAQFNEQNGTNLSIEEYQKNYKEDGTEKSHVVRDLFAKAGGVVKDAFGNVFDGIKGVLGNFGGLGIKALTGDIKGLWEYNLDEHVKEDNPLRYLVMPATLAAKLGLTVPTLITWLGKTALKGVFEGLKVVGKSVIETVSTIGDMAHFMAAGDVTGLFEYDPTSNIAEDNPLFTPLHIVFTGMKLGMFVPTFISKLGHMLVGPIMDFFGDMKAGGEVFFAGLSSAYEASTNGDVDALNAIEFTTEDSPMAPLFGFLGGIARMLLTGGAYVRKFFGWIGDKVGGLLSKFGINLPSFGDDEEGGEKRHLSQKVGDFLGEHLGSVGSFFDTLINGKKADGGDGDLGTGPATAPDVKPAKTQSSKRSEIVQTLFPNLDEEALQTIAKSFGESFVGAMGKQLKGTKFTDLIGTIGKTMGGVFLDDMKKVDGSRTTIGTSIAAGTAVAVAENNEATAATTVGGTVRKAVTTVGTKLKTFASRLFGRGAEDSTGDQIPGKLPTMRGDRWEAGNDAPDDVDASLGRGPVKPMSQKDNRWATRNNAMATEGCGPTAAAMVASAYGKGDPGEADRMSRGLGMRATDGGTDPAFFGQYAKSKGFGMKEGPVNSDRIKSNLTQGKPVVMMGKGGDFGSGTHYLVADRAGTGNSVGIVDPLTGGRKTTSLEGLTKNSSTAVYSWGRGPAEDLKEDLSPNASVAQTQVSLWNAMKSKEKSLKYDQSWGKQDPDKGSASCASTVAWAYRKVLGINPGGSSGFALSREQYKDPNFVRIYTREKGGPDPDFSQLQVGDIVYFNNETPYFQPNIAKSLKHTEMYGGLGNDWSHGGGSSGKELGPKLYSVSANRKKSIMVINRYKPFTTGEDVKGNAVGETASSTQTKSQTTGTTATSTDSAVTTAETATAGESSYSSPLDMIREIFSTINGAFMGGFTRALGGTPSETGATTGNVTSTADTTSSATSDATTTVGDTATAASSAASEATGGTFPKYALNDAQLKGIANILQHEQSGIAGREAEASLMANLTDMGGNDKATVSNLVKKATGGWFAYGKKRFNNPGNPEKTAMDAARRVLVEGKRTLPRYVNEHDCFSDLTSVSNNGQSFKKTDRSQYKTNVTKIKNRYGSSGTFYTFPDSRADPFFYTSEAMRKKWGEDHYPTSATGKGPGPDEEPCETCFGTGPEIPMVDELHGAQDNVGSTIGMPRQMVEEMGRLPGTNPVDVQDNDEQGGEIDQVEHEAMLAENDHEPAGLGPVKARDFGRGPVEGTDTNGSSSKSVSGQQALVDRMASIKGKIRYDLGSVQDPDKGVASCASTVGWAYRKALNVTGMSASSTEQSKDSRFTTIYTNQGNGLVDTSKLQPGDIMYYHWNKTKMGSDGKLQHTEMYAGNGQDWNHGGDPKYGPVLKTLNDYRKKHVMMVRRYKPFMDGTPVNVTATDGETSTATTTDTNGTVDTTGATTAVDTSASSPLEYIRNIVSKIAGAISASFMKAFTGGSSEATASTSEDAVATSTATTAETSADGTTTTGSETSTTGATSGTTLTGSTDAEKIWNFLRGSMGLTPIAAAGVMGNWQQESGNKASTVEGYYLKGYPGFNKVVNDVAARNSFVEKTLWPSYAKSGINVNQSGYKGNPDDGSLYPGFGLAQWTGPRAQNLFNFAKANGGNWGDLGTQLSFFATAPGEFAGSKPRSAGLKDDMNKASSVSDAAVMFLKRFEGINSPTERSRRSKNAQDIYNRYKDLQVGETGKGPALPEAATMGTVDDEDDIRRTAALQRANDGFDTATAKPVRSKIDEEESTPPPKYGTGADPSANMVALGDQIRDMNRSITRSQQEADEESSAATITSRIAEAVSNLSADGNATASDGVNQAILTTLGEVVKLLGEIRDNTKAQESSDSTSAINARYAGRKPDRPRYPNGNYEEDDRGGSIVRNLTRAY